MDADVFARIALPSALVVNASLTLALPMIRHRVRHGAGTGFMIAVLTDPVEKIVGWAMTAQSAMVAIYAAAFAALGPAPLSVWSYAPWISTYVGLAWLAMATVGLMVGQAQMGRSWRMCIDENRTPLVTDGLFSLVRNPIYVCSASLAVGVAIIAPSPWSIMLAFNGALFVSIQTRLEERHLVATHGDAYVEYSGRVGRFLPGVGRLTRADTEPVETRNLTT